MKTKFEKFKKLGFLFVLLISLFAPVLASPTKALSADFSTSYDITFKFLASGQAQVTQKIILKNKTDSLYASEYSLSIGSTRVSNISATDRLGGLAITTATKDSTTTITAKLNDKVVGAGKTSTLTVNYTIDDLALKRGLIWEVDIPKIVTSEEVESYSLTLIVPNSYGVLHSIVPEPKTKTSDTDNQIFNFNKDSQNASISASFGTSQQFKFDLKYRLRNPNFLSATGTIALPPDTDQQQMVFSTISPQPKKVYSDPDGNYLADFVVKGNSNLEIDVSGYAKVSDQTETIQKVAPSSQDEMKKYILADKYWEVSDPTIQKKAKELKSPKDIYDFVSQTLKYNYNRLKQPNPDRQGAVKALQNPTNSICTDYTDLFITLARANGIPARELEGFAYTDNSNTRPTKVGGLTASNILHAWPEYYDKDKSRWIAVDPTWGSTTGGVNYFDKLDTNHLVFAIHGSSSVSPVPAGGYKITGNETDDLKVEFSPEPDIKNESLIVTPDFGSLVGGLPSGGQVTIKNPNGRAILQPKISIDVVGAQISSDQEFTEDALLPFQTKVYTIKLIAGDLLSTRKANVKISVSGMRSGSDYSENFSNTILVKPFFLSFNPVSALAILAVILLIALFPPVFNRLKILAAKKLPFT